MFTNTIKKSIKMSKKLSIALLAVFFIGIANVNAQTDATTETVVAVEEVQAEETVKTCAKTGKVCDATCENKKNGTCCKGEKKKACSKKKSKCSKSKSACNKTKEGNFNFDKSNNYGEEKSSCSKKAKKGCSKSKASCCKSKKKKGCCKKEGEKKSCSKTVTEEETTK